MFDALYYILHAHWISWIMHFIGFLVFARYSGIKVEWAVGFVFGIEIWEMLDWSLKDPLRWWRMPDTYIDIIFGILGIILGRMLLLRHERSKP